MQFIKENFETVERNLNSLYSLTAKELFLLRVSVFINLLAVAVIAAKLFLKDKIKQVLTVLTPKTQTTNQQTTERQTTERQTTNQQTETEKTTTERQTDQPPELNLDKFEYNSTLLRKKYELLLKLYNDQKELIKTLREKRHLAYKLILRKLYPTKIQRFCVKKIILANINDKNQRIEKGTTNQPWHCAEKSGYLLGSRDEIRYQRGKEITDRYNEIAPVLFELTSLLTHSNNRPNAYNSTNLPISYCLSDDQYEFYKTFKDAIYEPEKIRAI